MSSIAHAPAREQALAILDQIITCDRVRPRLRDLGDIAALDARRANLIADLQRLEPAIRDQQKQLKADEGISLGEAIALLRG